MKVFLVKHYKLLGFLAVIGLGLFFSSAFASASYERYPTGYDITSPVYFSVKRVGAEWNDFNSWCVSGDVWDIVVRATDGEGSYYYFFSEDNSCDTIEKIIKMDLPNPNESDYPFYDYVGVQVFTGAGQENPDGDKAIEYNNGEYLFEVGEGLTALPMFPFMGSIVGSCLAYIGRLFTDLSPAVLLLCGFAIAFWFIYKFLVFWNSNFRQ